MTRMRHATPSRALSALSALFALTAAMLGAACDGSEPPETVDEGGCSIGTTLCATGCTDTSSDDANCGSCGNHCGSAETCVTGTCVTGGCVAGETSCGCAAGETSCGGACVDTNSDTGNCGSCGTNCAAGSSCESGTCIESAGHPNEPAGLTPFFQHDWQTWTPDHSSWWAASHAGYVGGPGLNSQGNAVTELIDDPAAPHGYGKSLRLTLRENKTTGTGIANWTFLSHPSYPSNDLDHTEMSRVYMSFWLFFEPDENGKWHSFQNLRLFTWNRHGQNEDCSGNNLIGARIQNPNAGPVATEWREFDLWFRDTCEQTNTQYQRMTPGPSIGTWIQYEVLLDILNHDPGEMRLRAHVDGNPTPGIDSVVLIGRLRPDIAQWFRAVHINFNVNGVGSTNLVPQDYHFRLGGYYISGLPVGS
jgi:hypothetical protein